MSLHGFGHYFPTDLSKKGIFNTYKNSITYKCSSTRDGKCDNIFNDETDYSGNNYWTSGYTDPYFEVILKRGYIFPEYGAIFSCYFVPCISKFAILGIQKGENQFKEICNYSVTSGSEFKGSTGLYPCSFDKPLKAVRIENRANNSNGKNSFALYVFDFYGYISFGFCTFSHHLHITFIPHISLFLVD